MVPLRVKSGLILAFLVLLMTGNLLVITSTASDFQLSYDTIRPNIWDWNYTGRPNASEAFSVWANVTDNEGGVGILNVTINISGPNVTIHDLMTFNGTFYEADVEAFPNPGEFHMYVRAFDLNNNTRDGRILTVIIEADVPPPVDPILTLPLVVSSSLVLAVIVVMIALMYDRRTNAITISAGSSEIAS